MTKYLQCKETGKFIEASEWEAKYGKRKMRCSAMIQGDIEPFVSPIDGKIVTGRASLREHNKRHGVTNIADYSDDYFKKKGVELSNNAQGKTEVDKQERKQLIDHELSKHGV